MGENVGSPVADGVQIVGYESRDELVSVRVISESKRIFAALCENDRGRFIKISDRRAKLHVPERGISQLRDALVGLETALESHPRATSDDPEHPLDPADVDEPVASSSRPDETKPDLIETRRFASEGRKFYLDVLENPRGRYVKITQSSVRRITMAMPITALSLLREGIDMLLEKAPPDTAVADPSSVHRVTRTMERVLPMKDGASITLNVVRREIHLQGKRIIFESGTNRRGSYLKIMENSAPQRMIVTLPHSTVPEVIKLLEEVVAAGDPAEATTMEE